MTREDLDIRFEDSEPVRRKLSITTVAEYMEYATVEIKMDPITLDYFYEMDCDEVINSDMPMSLLDGMEKDGWGYSDDKKKIIIHLKS